MNDTAAYDRATNELMRARIPKSRGEQARSAPKPAKRRKHHRHSEKRRG
jgi:hypothetical protein